MVGGGGGAVETTENLLQAAGGCGKFKAFDSAGFVLSYANKDLF